MRIHIERNFLSESECQALNAITLQGISEGWVNIGISLGHYTDTRLTSRLYMKNRSYPDLVNRIQDRIRTHLGLEAYPLIEGHGSYGAVTSYTRPSGDVYLHQDPRSFAGLASLRCNVLTQAADSGAVLRVGGEVVDIGVGDLHCYLASEHKHEVSTVLGNTARILWMFGAAVPVEFWEK
jgi:hypothetical protein